MEIYTNSDISLSYEESDKWLIRNWVNLFTLYFVYNSFLLLIGLTSLHTQLNKAQVTVVVLGQGCVILIIYSTASSVLKVSNEFLIPMHEWHFVAAMTDYANSWFNTMQYKNY